MSLSTHVLDATSGLPAVGVGVLLETFRDGLWTEVAEEGDGLADTTDTDGELWDAEVGDDRAGRLLERDGGGAPDGDEELWASDVGVDGASASGEEAAVHVVGERSDYD